METFSLTVWLISEEVLFISSLVSLPDLGASKIPLTAPVATPIAALIARFLAFFFF